MSAETYKNVGTLESGSLTLTGGEQHAGTPCTTRGKAQLKLAHKQDEEPQEVTKHYTLQDLLHASEQGVEAARNFNAPWSQLALEDAPKIFPQYCN